MKNNAKIVGKLAMARGDGQGVVLVERHSGIVDVIPVIYEGIYSLVLDEKYEFNGYLKTENIVDQEGNRHKMHIIKAESCRLATNQEDINELEFECYICAKLPLRATPLTNRYILDITCAINTEKGDSYYPSVVVWNKQAKKINELPVGTRLAIKGRFQSREYCKPGETKNRLAYEISCSEFEVIE